FTFETLNDTGLCSDGFFQTVTLSHKDFTSLDSLVIPHLVEFVRFFVLFELAIEISAFFRRLVQFLVGQFHLLSEPYRFLRSAFVLGFDAYAGSLKLRKARVRF